jgi:hypothetical protein
MELDSGLDVMDYGKHGKFSKILFLCTPYSIVDSVAIAQPNTTIGLPTSFCPLPLTLLAPQDSSSILLSFGHDNRLVIPNPVHTFATFSPFI